jgi:hypothetical protein
MATEGVSGTRVTGVPLSRPGNSGAAQDSSGTTRQKQSRSTQSSAPRQVINIDGKSFDRHAPRGTYLNILV